MDEALRAQVVADLEERGRLLTPDASLIAHALARCARYDRRLRGGPQVAAAANPAASRKLASLTEAAARGTDSDIGTGPLPADEGLLPGSDRLAIPEEVAAAMTEPEQASPLQAADQDAAATPFTGSFRRGQQIAGYRIEGRLGKGGMGHVYRALQLSMGRQVALKILAPRLASDQSFRTRFLREARNAGRLQHPNLLAVHDVGEADGLLFFSMELVEGCTVGDLLRKRGHLSEREALDVVQGVLEALAYAHRNGLIHRDIKPDNIMITRQNAVKVADLGLSREADADSSAAGVTTQSGTMMGTPYYMPPEQAHDAHSVDLRADLYSVGATLYHMVCGRVPFTGRTAVEVVVKASTAPLAFPEPQPSRAVQDLLRRLMEKDPRRRPQTALEALAMLAPLRGDSTTRYGSLARSGVSMAWRTRLQRARPWLLWSGLAGAVLLLALIVGQRIRVGERLEDLRAEADLLLAEDKAYEAHEKLRTFLQHHPGQEARVESLQARIDHAWNRETRRRVGPALAAFESARMVNDYAAAANIIDGLAQDPVLQSPEMHQDVLPQMKAKLREQQQLAWEQRRDECLEELQGHRPDLAAARRILEDFKPVDEEIQREKERLMNELGIAQSRGTSSGSSGSGPFATIRAMPQDALRISDDGLSAELSGQGRAWVPDPARGGEFQLLVDLPDEARMSWHIGPLRLGGPGARIHLGEGRVVCTQSTQERWVHSGSAPLQANLPMTLRFEQRQIEARVGSDPPLRVTARRVTGRHGVMIEWNAQADQPIRIVQDD